MSNKTVDQLEAVFAVERSKIAYILHGIPDVPLLDPSYFNDKFGVMGKQILSTFGLLSQNKEIERVKGISQ